jgi:hypothetical protein
MGRSALQDRVHSPSSHALIGAPTNYCLWGPLSYVQYKRGGHGHANSCSQPPLKICLDPITKVQEWRKASTTSPSFTVTSKTSICVRFEAVRSCLGSVSLSLTRTPTLAPSSCRTRRTSPPMRHATPKKSKPFLHRLDRLEVAL